MQTYNSPIKTGCPGDEQPTKHQIVMNTNLTDLAVDNEGFDPTKYGFSTETIVHIRKDEVACKYWTYKRDAKTSEWNIHGLYFDALLNHLEKQLFAKRYRSDKQSFQFVQGDAVIKPVIPTNMRDELIKDIDLNPEEIEQDYISSTSEGQREIFLRQHHLIINKTGLELLTTHTRPLQRDTKTSCFIPYENGIVEVKAGSVTLHTYELLENTCVWQSAVLTRHVNLNVNGDDCHYARFIRNISNGEPDRILAARTAIGYLIHNYQNPTEGQAVILNDEAVTDKSEGGSGKGLFGNAISQMRPTVKIDGKGFDADDRFCFQQVEESTAVVWLDDPKRNLPFERFFSSLTDGWSIEKKNQHRFFIPYAEGPKLLIAANHALPNEGSSNVRRQFVIEFSDYYQKNILSGTEKPIQAEHGCTFFSSDWNKTEWQQFDAYMIGCVQEYLRSGLKPYALRSVNQNRLLQKAGSDFVEFVSTYDGTGLQPGIEYGTVQMFSDFQKQYGANDWKQRRFSDCIQLYAKCFNFKYVRGGSGHQPTFKL